MRVITAEDIDNRELTPEEKGWLIQRDRHADVARNEALFGRPVQEGSNEREFGVGPQGDTPETEAATDNYESWKKAELVAEGEGRTPPVDFTGCSKKEDFVLALRSWDMEHPETDEE